MEETEVTEKLTEGLGKDWKEDAGRSRDGRRLTAERDRER